MTVDVSRDWAALGSVAPGALREARVELHWAAQAIERVGKSLVREAPDHRHIALRWIPAHRALASAKVGEGWRAALELAGARLFILDPWNEIAEDLALSGRSLGASSEWVRSRLAPRIGSDREWKDTRCEDLPASRIGEGGAFSEPGEAHDELARWYAAAAPALGDVAAGDDPFGPVLCWPHHFDLATRADFEPDEDPVTARSVGVGFSPGDAVIRAPYFYVLPWPAPDRAALDGVELEGGGSWETRGFTGARLDGADLLSLAPDARADAARAFLDGGLRAAKDLLDL